jgi:hypothetical protein
LLLILFYKPIPHRSRIFVSFIINRVKEYDYGSSKDKEGAGELSVHSDPTDSADVVAEMEEEVVMFDDDATGLYSMMDRDGNSRRDHKDYKTYNYWYPPGPYIEIAFCFNMIHIFINHSIIICCLFEIGSTWAEFKLRGDEESLVLK